MIPSGSSLNKKKLAFVLGLAFDTTQLTGLLKEVITL